MSTRIYKPTNAAEVVQGDLFAELKVYARTLEDEDATAGLLRDLAACKNALSKLQYKDQGIVNHLLENEPTRTEYTGSLTGCSCVYGHPVILLPRHT